MCLLELKNGCLQPASMQPAQLQVFSVLLFTQHLVHACEGNIARECRSAHGRRKNFDAFGQGLPFSTTDIEGHREMSSLKWAHGQGAELLD